MWMKEYVRLIHVMTNSLFMKNRCIGSSRNIWRCSSAAMTWRECFRAAKTVPSTVQTAVAALPSW